MAAPTIDFLLSGGATRTFSLPFHKLNGTAAPTAGDDDADGFNVGSYWIDTTNDHVYQCVDNTTGAAVWRKLDDTAPTGSAGGDLGGTYPNPTVNQASGAFALAGTIGVNVSTLTYNDWTPTGLSSAELIRISSSGSAVVTGISGGSAGRLLTLACTGSGSNTVAFKHADTGSSAANRILSPTGGTVTITANEALILQYDGTDSRWRIVSVVNAAVANPAASSGAVVGGAAGGSATTSTVSTTGYTWLELEGQAAGGGGGGGAVQSGTAHTGGNGGSGGNRGRVLYKISDLGLSAGDVYVYVGAAGQGGAGAAGPGAGNGTAGGDGGSLTVQKDNSSGAVIFQVDGGKGGKAGQTSTSTNTANDANNTCQEVGGVGGVSSVSASVAGGSTYLAGAGGQAGVSLDAINASASQAAAGTLCGRDGSVASPTNEPVGTNGAAGGAASSAGSNANDYGGGGGGGGAGALAGGAGGNGGKGILRYRLF